MPEELNFTPELYTLVDEEGKEQTFELLDVMELDDERYFALIPYFEDPDAVLQDDGELVILKAEEVDGEELMASIDDDEEFDRVGAIFLKRLENMYEFEDDDDDHDHCDCCHHS